MHVHKHIDRLHNVNEKHINYTADSLLLHFLINYF